MLFNSFEFLIFFPTVLAAYHLVSARCQPYLLLIASYYFYMSLLPLYGLLLIALTVLGYVAGFLVAARAEGNRLRLGGLVACALAPLLFFKYTAFLLQTVESFSGGVARVASPGWVTLALPIGLSFHCFQLVSYIVDIYRGEAKPEKSFVRFSLFLAFFPQLVAGPIERANDLLPQFETPRATTPVQLRDGLRLILWGFFKKLVVADNLGIFVDQVFNDPTSYQGGSVWLAFYCFTLQLYGDFSGYSDIARGSAKMLGYELTENFCRPLFADSLRDLWNRWHITLNTWFRDYLYRPLGGNRKGALRRSANLLFVFCISGFWHGASWTFGAWGLFHGVAIAIERWWQGKPADANAKRGGLLRRLVVVHVLVIGFVIFRAKTLADVGVLFGQAFSSSIAFSFAPAVAWGLAGAAVLLAAELAMEKKQTWEVLFQASRWRFLRWFAYYAMILTIFFFGRFDEQAFLYFQF